MPELPKTRIAVVGAGAFGQNHLRVWQELRAAGAPVELCAIVEPDAQLAACLALPHGCSLYSTVGEMLAARVPPDAASVAVPTLQHFDVAAELLTAGIDVLLEKPMTATLDQADQLIALSEQHTRILQIGHLERFNPAVRAVRPIVHRPLFFEVHRLSVFTPRSLDVDVVLDLMIHDLDVVLSLVESPIRELRAVGLPVLSKKVDIANVRIEFESGCVANFTASRVSTERVRKMRFFQPHQYVSIDYARQDVLCVDVADTETVKPADIPPFAKSPIRQAQGRLRMGHPDFSPAINFQPAEQRHPTPELTMRKLEVPAGEPLRLELESFLASVRNRTRPEGSAGEGRAALAVALDILSTIQAHQSRAGLG